MLLGLGVYLMRSLARPPDAHGRRTESTTLLITIALVSAIAARGAAGALRNSLFRSGYELLFTPLVEWKKRPTKAIVDVGFDKLGSLVGGGIAMLAVVWAPSTALRILFGLCCVAAPTSAPNGSRTTRAPRSPAAAIWRYLFFKSVTATSCVLCWSTSRTKRYRGKIPAGGGFRGLADGSSRTKRARL